MYESKLSLIETQKGIKKIKDFFQTELAKELNLLRVSAPLFVPSDSGLNDNLNGVERPVSFDLLSGETIQIVHSLAKWKRKALKDYGFSIDEGLYTDMNAIRRDETLSNIHSIYVDQWDWEKIILEENRTTQNLYSIVQQIYRALVETEKSLLKTYPQLTKKLPDEITFITSQELENLYPNLSPKEREDEICKKYGAVFISQIGKVLNSGKVHDLRAPDYDDWELNGDILLYNPILKRAFEISSMGIRVDEEAMDRQLTIAGADERRDYDFHKAILEKKLPYSIGGGIGQSRLCMYFLRKAHIGEVQVSVWPEEMIRECAENKIFLL